MIAGIGWSAGFAWMSASRAISEPRRWEQLAMLTLAEANQVIAATLARARNMNMKIAVSVCDDEGRLVAFQRMDGVLEESIPDALGKAIAAAALRKSGGDKDDAFDLHSVWRVANIGLFNAKQGGLPINRDAQRVGAIGVSGSATEQEDEQCAKAGIEAFAQSS